MLEDQFGGFLAETPGGEYRRHAPQNDVICLL
jgi:hypothetical protein